MAYSLNYDDDATDTDIYASNCGLISKLSEELKYRLQDGGADDHIITGLEVMEYDYWNEADGQSEFWEDMIKVDVDDMTVDQLKEAIIDRLPSVTPMMSHSNEMDFIRSV